MDALEYTKKLVSFETTSVLSNVAVTDYAQETLDKLGFVTERIDYVDANGVAKANVIGKKGEGTGGMAYFGHTDVVPADPWFSKDNGPFSPFVEGGKLYGRGTCDMKGSVACILAAAEQFDPSQFREPLYVTCTADEEIGYGGAAQVAERSELFREMVENDTRGIIGEPTMLEVVYSHKGTYGFKAISHGRAAHSSTKEGLNANLAMIPFLAEMKKLYDMTESNTDWHNDEFDPPTVTCNIGINDHTKAINITPPQSICTMYFRPMPGQKPQELLDVAKNAAEKAGIEFQPTARANPMYVDPESPFIQEMLELAGKTTATTVCYGTDGAKLNELKRLVVFGPGDIAQAHTENEWVELEQLELGTEAYSRLVRRWCC